jgi:hypothetical protein
LTPQNNALFLIRFESFLNHSIYSVFSGFMNVVLKGIPKQTIDAMVKLGYATTQSEAIRLAVFWFGKEHLDLDELAARKLDKLYKEHKAGNRKEYSAKEMAKKFPELKELV